jgi:FixJ family two-component response regulator
MELPSCVERREGVPPVLSSSTICIVDDDEGVRASIENYLRSAGVNVRTYGSAEGFLSSQDFGSTACLITDLHMPGMDGIALQEELMRQGQTFPVIIMTAFPTRDAEERSRKLGAIAFLSKPIDPDLLLDRVERMFE